MTRNSNTIPMPKLSELIIDGSPTPMCWDYNSKLSKVVVSKCFSKYTEYFERDDLIALAVADSVAFTIKLARLNKDEDIKNIRNVLFTRIRNTLSNFIFRSNKLINTEDTVLDKQSTCSKHYEIDYDVISSYDLLFDSIDSFRTVSLKTWNLFKSNGARTKYFINDDTNNIEDWEAFSEVRNMRSPCDLINTYNKYTEDQIETLALKLDSVSGQNYFSTLYQLLGDKFLAFLDVFQEDQFSMPSTALVKRVLDDISICEDHSKGMSVNDISKKYNKKIEAINKIIASKDVI